MNQINVAWHNKHKMPKNPSLKERVKWHTEHVKHCPCRPMPKKLLEEMKRI